MEGFRRAGIPKSGETVLVMGVNGKVGQAATQIATWHGARVIGVDLRAGAGSADWRIADLTDPTAATAALRTRRTRQAPAIW